MLADITAPDVNPAIPALPMPFCKLLGLQVGEHVSQM
jgi:hypothetical protein